MTSEVNSEASEEKLRRFHSRYDAIKRGNEYLKDKNYIEAITSFNQYLNLIAQFYEIKFEELSPEKLKGKIDEHEIFLISKIYLEIALLFDKTSSRDNLVKYLNKFSLFTKGSEFQHIHGEKIVQLLRRNKIQNIDIFQEMLRQLNISSGACYLATYILEPGHPLILKLRKYRDNKLNQSKSGCCLIKTYYSVSIFVIKINRYFPYIFTPFHFLIRNPLKLTINLFTRKHDSDY